MRGYAALLVLGLLLCLRPAGAQALNPSLAQLARELAPAIDQAGLQRVGVPEFANAGGTLGGDTDAAGHYVAERIEECLINAPGHRYTVIERRRLNAVLQEARVQSSGLTAEESCKEIVGRIRGLDALVVGSMARTGKTLHVGCKVVRLPDAVALAARSVDVPLEPDLLTLFGDSLLLPAAAVSPALAPTVEAPAPAPARRQPQLDPACPYGLEVVVGGRPKPLYQHESDLLIPASRGETYRIRLANRSAASVGVALFIDGLNTIGGKREIPSGATKWVVRPGQTMEIPGWQLAADHAREFVFVGVEESLAARQRFTDEVGLISAAFYPEAAPEAQPQSGDERRGGLGTGAGNRIATGITKVAFRAAATPAAILSLHYDDAAVVEQYAPAR